MWLSMRLKKGSINQMVRGIRPMRSGCLLLLKLLFVYPFKGVCMVLRYVRNKRYDIKIRNYPDTDEWLDDNDNEEDIVDELNRYDNLPEIPDMCQIFSLDSGNCIGVEYVSMCPDETAHIRIIGDTSFSQMYKRRVYTEKSDKNARYFKLNNKKYYLDPKRTQPIEPTQAKPGK